ncbi:hypothetical protein EJ04DRAFT_76151 [Polyplosphaeria fusca]|uniref:DUF2293 domain-containing protein n=1 Tax=Polyplosphaeria fusca TaxID=682080 RepID=A0A9P4QQJ3_9PLEO|nr:hypothetical protein EJ04DRAFT_76151 [Polyplosphaeria fusca]
MAPPKREYTVSPRAPMPSGYAFLRKGNRYQTLNCRRLTHDAGKTVYVVQNDKKTATGIRVPKSILLQVQAKDRTTLSSRRAATETRDAAVIRKAEAELDDMFPNIPKAEKAIILKRAFQKYSRRVGRSSQTPMPRKVQLAVIAHVRHKHTTYDALLEQGRDRENARKAVTKKMQEVLRKWGARGGKIM